MICSANQWNGFYRITASVMKELIRTKINIFPITAFFLSWAMDWGFIFMQSHHRIYVLQSCESIFSLQCLHIWNHLYVAVRLSTNWTLVYISSKSWFSQLIYFFFQKSVLELRIKCWTPVWYIFETRKNKRRKISLVDTIDSSVVCSLLCFFIFTRSYVQRLG